MCTIHDICFEHYSNIFTKKEYYTQKLLIPYAAKKSKAVFTVSNHAKQDIASHYHIPESNLVVTYNAVNQNFRKLNEEELNESELRNKFDITGNRIILSVGNLQPRKNLPRLMRAFVKLKKDSHFSDVQLVVVGKKAWMFDDIMKESADNNKDIILTDYVSNEDLVRLYNLADGFVYPSFYEGFGIPPLEARACGTPVAVANATSLPEVVGDAGMYFDPFSEEEITNSIVKLLDEDKAMPTDVFNICGGYFALIGYVLVQNLTISKEQIQKIFVNYTKLIVLFFFIQYAIFKISGNIIFIDFYNPQMRAGFLRAGVGSEFVALSIIIMFAEFLQTYRKKKRFDIKLIIWMGIFSVYFVLFICIRAAILAIFLSCLVLVFIGTDSRKLKLGILLLGVLGGALILQSSVFDKYMQIDKIEGGGSITGRLAMYAYYFNGFMQHPIMGQGFIKPINSALTTLLYRVWFGCKCIVLKGSEILRDTVIAAGSIVSGKQTVHS